MALKSMEVFFITVQTLAGFDTGFFSVLNKRCKAIANCISLLSTVTILSLSIFGLILGVFGAYFYTIHYIIIILLFKFRRSKHTLKNLYDDLLIIDDKWKTGINNYKFFIFIGYYELTMTFLKLIVTLAYAVVFGSNDVVVRLKILLPVIPVFATDLINIINAVIFYDVYKRFNVLKIGLNSSKYGLKSAQGFFIDIADYLDKVRLEFDNQIVLAFIYDVLKVMISMYNYLAFVLKNPNWIVQVMGSIYPIYYTLQLILPAYFAEMIAVEVDEIKMILHDRLLLEQDETKSADFLRLLRYVEARPLLRKAWRLVPVDLRLPVTMLSICTTYLIVTIQFTHLFD